MNMPRSTDITNLAFPYSCIVHKPNPAVEYYEAYKNIGRKYTLLKNGVDFGTVMGAAVGAIIAKGTILLKAGTFMQGSKIILEACDSGWESADAEVTVSHDTTDKQEGTASVKIDVDEAHTTGLVAYKNFASPQDLTEYQSIGLWLKPSILLSSSAYHLVLSESNNCSTEDLVLPLFHPESMEADIWKFQKPPTTVALYSVPIDFSGMNEVRSIGIKCSVDKGALTIRADEITVSKGIVMVTDGTKKITVKGAGKGVTIIKQNDAIDIPQFYVKNYYFTCEDLEVDGNSANQRAIDGCDGIFLRFASHAKIDVYVHDTKGSGVKLRDLRDASVEVEGENTENPVVAMTGASYCYLNVYGKNCSNDDYVWCKSGSSFNEIYVRGEESVAGINGVRVEGGSGSECNYNLVFAEIDSVGGFAAYLGLYAYHNEFHVKSKDCQRGFYTPNGQDAVVFVNAVNSGKENVYVGGDAKRIELYVNCVGGGTEVTDHDSVSIRGTDITVRGSIRDSEREGIRLESTSLRCKIDLTIQGSLSQGAKVLGSGHTIKGHYFDNAGDGVRLENAVGCRVEVRATDTRTGGEKTQDCGVREIGTSDYNIILGCNVLGNIDETIPTVGANTISEHNQVGV